MNSVTPVETAQDEAKSPSLLGLNNLWVYGLLVCHQMVLSTNTWTTFVVHFRALHNVLPSGFTLFCYEKGLGFWLHVLSRIGTVWMAERSSLIKHGVFFFFLLWWTTQINGEWLGHMHIHLWQKVWYIPPQGYGSRTEPASVPWFNVLCLEDVFAYKIFTRNFL